MSQATEPTRGPPRDRIENLMRGDLADAAAWEDVTPDYEAPATSKDVRVTLRLDAQAAARLRSRAAHEGIGWTQLVRRLALERLEQLEAPERGGPLEQAVERAVVGLRKAVEQEVSQRAS